MNMSRKNRKKGHKNCNGSCKSGHSEWPVVRLDEQMIDGIVSPNSSIQYPGEVGRGQIIAEVKSDGGDTRYFNARAAVRKPGRTVLELGRQHESHPYGIR